MDNQITQHQSLENKLSERNRKKVRDEFRRRGISVAEWARAKNFDRQLVYRVLSGKAPAIRGESYRIALALGLRAGRASSVKDFDYWLSQESNAN